MDPTSLDGKLFVLHSAFSELCLCVTHILTYAALLIKYFYSTRRYQDIVARLKAVHSIERRSVASVYCSHYMYQS